MIELVDIGANLTHRSFHRGDHGHRDHGHRDPGHRDHGGSGDLDDVLGRARAAGVVTIVVTGTSVTASRAAWELAVAHPRVLRATAGVHPHEARRWGSDAREAIAELLRRPEVVAVGECGLDYDRDFSPRPAQRRAFEEQLELAAAARKPVFLHERAAHADFVSILAAHRARLPPAVVHCFTGDAAALDAYLALDLHIGVTGWICDERRGLGLRALVARVPPDRLMIETDAPFLTPRGIPDPPRHGRNEPSLLVHVARAAAAARGESLADFAAATTRTARAFFGLTAGGA